MWEWLLQCLVLCHVFSPRSCALAPAAAYRGKPPKGFFLCLWAATPPKGTGLCILLMRALEIQDTEPGDSWARSSRLLLGWVSSVKGEAVSPEAASASPAHRCVSAKPGGLLCRACPCTHAFNTVRQVSKLSWTLSLFPCGTLRHKAGRVADL